MGQVGSKIQSAEDCPFRPLGIVRKRGWLESSFRSQGYPDTGESGETYDLDCLYDKCVEAGKRKKSLVSPFRADVNQEISVGVYGLSYYSLPKLAFLFRHP